MADEPPPDTEEKVTEMVDDPPKTYKTGPKPTSGPDTREVRTRIAGRALCFPGQLKKGEEVKTTRRTKHKRHKRTSAPNFNS